MLCDIFGPFRARLDARIVPDAEAVFPEYIDDGDHPMIIHVSIADKNKVFLSDRLNRVFKNIIT